MNLNHSKDQFSDVDNSLAPQSNLEQVSTSHVTSVVIQPNFVHPNAFFYQTPNDLCNYHINCKEISLEMAIQLLNELNGNTSDVKSNQNEYSFFYQQSDNRIYWVSCEIVTPLTLNKIIYGIEIVEQNFGQERLSFFTFYQKENLKFYLTHYLSYYILN